MLSFTLSVLCAGVLFVSAAQFRNGKPRYELEDAEQHFAEFVRTHNRHYADAQEWQMRFEIFKKTLSIINKQNEESEHAVFGITHFADRTPEEKFFYMGLIPDNSRNAHCKQIFNDQIESYGAPENFDWRQKKAVTEVKNQGTCGCCWANAEMANIEGQYAIKNNELVSFSVQQLIDCDKKDHGCHGGTTATATESLLDMGGVMTEADYPFEGVNGDCKFNQSQVTVKLTGCNQYTLSDEEKLKQLLYSHGPLAMSIDATSVMGYTGGIMMNCQNNGHNHAVTLVGYGIENGIPYWTLKNSWGVGFGEEGYFRVKRGVNSCGLLEYLITSALL